jgi:hypothetical protein
VPHCERHYFPPRPAGSALHFSKLIRASHDTQADCLRLVILAQTRMHYFDRSVAPQLRHIQNGRALA